MSKHKKHKKKYPSIIHHGKKYYQVGCRECNHKNALWGLFLRKDKKRFVIMCPYCGHIEKIKVENVKTEHDKIINQEDNIIQDS